MGLKEIASGDKKSIAPRAYRYESFIQSAKS